MMLDIDFFKKLNDELGHEAGDKGLVELSKTMVSSVRKTDILVRLGGEEMGILSLGSDEDDAAFVDTKIADRLDFVEVKSEVDGKEVSRKFTYSMGIDNNKNWNDLVEVAHAEDPMLALSEFLRDADVALTEAKQGGRNRMVFAKPKDEVPVNKIEQKDTTKHP